MKLKILWLIIRTRIAFWFLPKMFRRDVAQRIAQVVVDMAIADEINKVLNDD